MTAIAATTVLLTGANGGIGMAIAVQLAARKARLVLTGRDAEKLEVLAASLRSGGASVRIIVADLAQPGAAARLVEAAVQSEGRIDTVVNCAGLQNFGFLADQSAEATEQLLRINTLAPIALTQAALPHMLRRGSGHVVNVGSIFGSIGFPCFAAYSASKFALRGFSEALRRELVGSGITVTYVAPRFTRTPMNVDAAARMADALRMNQDDPADVARQVIRQIEVGGADRYFGWPEKLFVRINSIFPRLVDRSLMKQVNQMRPFAAEQTP